MQTVDLLVCLWRFWLGRRRPVLRRILHARLYWIGTKRHYCYATSPNCSPISYAPCMRTASRDLIPQATTSRAWSPRALLIQQVHLRDFPPRRNGGCEPKTAEHPIGVREGGKHENCQNTRPQHPTELRHGRSFRGPRTAWRFDAPQDQNSPKQ